MSASETEIIIEHALLNESNMALAAKVGAAYEQLQRRVIRRFLERVRDELRGAFGPEWSVELEQQENSAPYLFARRSSWPEEVNFGVGSDDGCLTWVYIYVTKCSEATDSALLDQELEKSLTTTWERRCRSRGSEFFPLFSIGSGTGAMRTSTSIVHPKPWTT